MTRNVNYLLIGGGPASATAAETLRAEGAKGTILIIAAESELPYNRPPLSKQLLLGRQQPHQVYIFHESDYLNQHIDLLLNTRVIAVDPKAHLVSTNQSEKIHYDKLLIATGARPIKLTIPGIKLPGIYYLRTLAQSIAIKKAMDRAKRAVIIGGNFIGLELASSFTQMGIKVTLIVKSGALLSPMKTPEISDYLQHFYEQQGVEIIFDDTPARFLGKSRVEKVLTASGKTIPCDFAVLGVGVAPEVEFLEGSGIIVDNGIRVDEYLQTGEPDIFAAGDVANFFDPVFNIRRRLAHWDNAVKQGRLAAKNMLGQHQAYGECAYFFSNVFDLSFEFFGNIDDVDERILRGSPEEKSFALFYLKDNVPRALFTMHRPPQETKEAESMILNRINVHTIKDELPDPHFSLEKTATQTVLILQGGGAMGAFECGVVKALDEMKIIPNIIAGVSIGAFNGAVIAANPEHPGQALEAFWNDLTIGQAFELPFSPDADWRKMLAIEQSFIFGLPNFFRPRWFLPVASTEALPSNWTSFYDPSPVKKLLHKYVDFSQLRTSPVRLLVNAVDVETAELTTFDSRFDDLTADHILASGSLPPGFPWTTINGKHYWDGGIVSNSPLEQVIDRSGSSGKRVLIVDLYPNRRPLPHDIMGVMVRRDEIAYAERIRKDVRKSELIYNYRRLIDEMLISVDAMTAGEIKQRPRYIQVMGDTAPMTITRIIYEKDGDGQQPRDYDFSRKSIERHKAEGYKMACKALA